MKNREGIEADIRQILESEGIAAILSEKLFGPAGLFSLLAPTDAERRVIVRSELFRQAQARFHTLQQGEAAAFTRAVEEAEAAFPARGHRLKLEHLELT
jgi:hypothetical protein